mgnify:CR=1 FL=1|tara:strand:- start:4668 stop:4820 length:153 start_codon:yes stop_codon:yes gene_type:complete
MNAKKSTTRLAIQRTKEYIKVLENDKDHPARKMLRDEWVVLAKLYEYLYS